MNDGGRRVSQVETVAVAQGRAYGPIRLELQVVHEVRLRLINPPPAGQIRLSVMEEGGDPTGLEYLPITQREIVHALQLNGPATVSMRCTTDKPDSRAESNIRVQVDPAVQSEVIIDLHGDRCHKVEVRLNGTLPRGETILLFFCKSELSASRRVG